MKTLKKFIKNFYKVNYRLVKRTWNIKGEQWSRFLVQKYTSTWPFWSDVGSVYSDCGGGGAIGACPSDYIPYFHVRYFDNKKEAKDWIKARTSVETEVDEILDLQD